MTQIDKICVAVGGLLLISLPFIGSRPSAPAVSVDTTEADIQAVIKRNHLNPQEAASYREVATRPVSKDIQRQVEAEQKAEGEGFIAGCKANPDGQGCPYQYH